jgi:hypothetical protein
MGGICFNQLMIERMLPFFIFDGISIPSYTFPRVIEKYK